MNVIEPKNNLVRADSDEVENGFRQYDLMEEKYDYYLPLKKNINFDFNFTDPSRKGTEPDYVPVLNIKTDRIGIIAIDEMVEPVEFEVIVKEKA